VYDFGQIATHVKGTKREIDVVPRPIS